MYVLPCVILILCFSVFLLFREGICDLTDCLFEGVKIRKLDDSLWQFIPQDDRRQTGELKVICSSISDLIIPGIVTKGTAKIYCLGLILALFYSTLAIKNDFG